MNGPLRVAVIGAGAFGRNHARVLSALPDVELTAVVDTDTAKASVLAEEFHTQHLPDVGLLAGQVDAAVIATPTIMHEAVAQRLLPDGVDVLVEKPIAPTAQAGERMTTLAKKHERILQVGHLERFNPAVAAARAVLSIPLFFEVHRLSVFTPRSLDVDVVLDLMIHDLDLVLDFTGETPAEIRAAGISVLSPRVDIANVRLAFPSGCVANLTASRVSTEQVRKLRLFQPGEYLSIDYAKQETARLRILPNEFKSGQAIDANGLRSQSGISFERLPVENDEPLRLELLAFLHSVRTREMPRVTGGQAMEALRVAESILSAIEQHGRVVAETVRRRSG